MSVVEQICIIRAVEKSGSNFSISLEPKKVACATCDGKCVKMLKPAELIKLETAENVSVGQEVMLYMDKKELRSMIIRVLGAPLLVLLSIVALGSYFNIAEYILIASIFTALIVMFIWQVRYLKFASRINIRQVGKTKINVEK